MYHFLLYLYYSPSPRSYSTYFIIFTLFLLFASSSVLLHLDYYFYFIFIIPILATTTLRLYFFTLSSLFPFFHLPRRGLERTASNGTVCLSKALCNTSLLCDEMPFSLFFPRFLIFLIKVHFNNLQRLLVERFRIFVTFVGSNLVSCEA